MTETPRIIKDFDKLTQSIHEKNTPAWLKELSDKSLSQFHKLGLPNIKDEEWKYTNLAQALSRTYSIPQKGQFTPTAKVGRYINNKELNIVFVNGHFSKELSNVKNLPKGVTVVNLKEAITSKEETLKKILTRYDVDKTTAFIALNKAITTEGVYVEIAANTVCKELLHIVHLTDASGKDAITFPRSVIVSGKSSEATILESHISTEDNLIYLTNALTDIFVDENATLHYCKAQKESMKAYHINNTRVWQERDSHFDGFTLIAGSAINRNNLDIVLNGEGCDGTLNGLYSIYGNQHADNHTSVDHKFPNCTSNQLYKGILNGSSRAVFNGKIFVREAAQKTNSYQLNKNLLLGKDCRIDTKPQLEIFADDVKCTHGATVGQLDEDQLFYLQSRCIARKDAIKILARGFVDDLVNVIKNDSVNEKLHQLLEPSFAAL